METRDRGLLSAMVKFDKEEKCETKTKLDGPLVNKIFSDYEKLIVVNTKLGDHEKAKTCYYELKSYIDVDGNVAILTEDNFVKYLRLKSDFEPHEPVVDE